MGQEPAELRMETTMTELQASISAAAPVRRQWSMPIELQAVTLFSLLGLAVWLALLCLPVSDAPTALAFMP